MMKCSGSFSAETSRSKATTKKDYGVKWVRAGIEIVVINSDFYRCISSKLITSELFQNTKSSVVDST